MNNVEIYIELYSDMKIRYSADIKELFQLLSLDNIRPLNDAEEALTLYIHMYSWNWDY